MIAGLALAALLAAEPEPGDARAELDACAQRIEELKARRRAGEEAGRELERLLRRAQDLAAELERTAAELPPAPSAPAPDELRERADAWRDEADRLAADIAVLDVRIADARRAAHAEAGNGVERAALGRDQGPSTALQRLRELQAERAALAARRAQAEAEAAQLDRDAEAADADR